MRKGYDWKNKMKATAVAPSNIAFIKYWGKKDEKLRLPENGSISMNLDNLLTKTTVEFSSSFRLDQMIIDGEKELGTGFYRVVSQLNRIRRLAHISEKAKIVSKNNFPRGTGLSSSASGFAALTFAASKAAGLNLNEKELSTLTRFGSGSACRSIPDGFVEWLDGETSDSSYAVSLYPANYWNILDIVVIVSNEIKEVSSTEGQKLAKLNPFFPVRISRIKSKIAQLKKHLKEKNFQEFGELIESEAIELHAIMLTSKPSLMYWLPDGLRVMKMAKKWRDEGLPVYFTVNTGQNIHLIVEEKNKNKLLKKLGNFKGLKNIIVNKPSAGAQLTSDHLI